MSWANPNISRIWYTMAFSIRESKRSLKNGKFDQRGHPKEAETGGLASRNHTFPLPIVCQRAGSALRTDQLAHNRRAT